MDIAIVSIILCIALYLLVTEIISIDMTAIGIIVALIFTRILTPAEAVGGFASPAVITVGSMFLISRAMMRTGSVGYLAQNVIQYSRGNVKIATLLTLIIVALASAFINNTPVVVLFIPVILQLGCEYGLSPSKLLIPVSYTSILAGTCTLIGTSTNIIVSDLSFSYGYGKISMFELASLGVPIAVIGILFLYVTAPRLLPAHTQPTCDHLDREDKRYLAEFMIPRNSPLIGNEPVQYFADHYRMLSLYEVTRGGYIFYPDKDKIGMKAEDTLLIKGSANDLIHLLQEKVVQLAHQSAKLNFNINDPESIIIELVVPPQSSLLGFNPRKAAFFRDMGIYVIAMKRRRLHYSEQKMEQMRLRIGDILLVKCPVDKIDRIRAEGDFIIIEDVYHQIVQKKKAGIAFAIFAGVVATATLGIADIMVCALAGVLLMILTGCLPLRDAYRALQGDVLILIVGTIALGEAMAKTGASQVYAQGFLYVFHSLGPQFVLMGMLLFASISTQVLSNNATAVLLIPIAISTATALGVSPKPFIIAICFGASACYATPIGYQTNLMVYGPGGYSFADYLRLGIPLNILVLVMGSMFIPVFWPF
jgi:di/tricarboxylate transporter